MSSGITNVQFGRTGMRVSDVCLGTMTFGLQADKAASFEIMDIAAEAGINFIDVADVYPIGGGHDKAGLTEEIVGEWLKGRRENFVLASKGYGEMGPGPNDYGNSRKHLIAALEGSLRRLQTDYVDIYYVHRWDPLTPLEETMSTFEDMRRAGKIRYAACSNYTAWQMTAALWTSDRHHLARYEAIQPRYNLLFREIEREVVPAAQANGVAVVVYNPLAGGVLTGKYQPGESPREGTRFGMPTASQYRKRYWQDAQLEVVQRMKAELHQRGKSITHAALRWTMDQPGITSAIIGASKPDQLRDSLKGASLKLDDDDRKLLDRAWFEIPRRTPAEEGTHT